MFFSLCCDLLDTFATHLWHLCRKDSTTCVSMYESLRFDFCTSYSFGHYLVTFFNQFSYTNFLGFFGLQSNCCFQHFLCRYTYQLTVPLCPAILSGFVQWIAPVFLKLFEYLLHFVHIL